MSQYNQTKHAEYILKNGFSSKFLKAELRILALYLREQGLPPKERKDKIYELCEKYIEGFNRVRYFKTINSVITYSSNKRHKLIDINKIRITKNELDFIDSLDVDYLCKKVLFGFIVLNKLGKEKWAIENERDSNDEHFFVNSPHSYRNLTKTLGLDRGEFRKYGYQKIYDVTRKLINEGLLEDTINNTKLLFMYDIPTGKDITMDVVDYENIGLYYDLHSGIKNVKECGNCSVPIKVKSNSTRYCRNCADLKTKESKRKWWNSNSY